MDNEISIYSDEELQAYRAKLDEEARLRDEEEEHDYYLQFD